jgi:hypothetical protein
MRVWLVAGLLALGPTPSPSTSPKLTNISTLEHFKNTFNAGQGKVRLVLLLSPT